jgi:hypothetical protein
MPYAKKVSPTREDCFNSIPLSFCFVGQDNSGGCVVPYPKYGHNTSNIVESLNGSLSDIRCQPPIRMMDSIYSYCMSLVFDRARKPQISLYLADIPWSKYLRRLKILGDSMYFLLVMEYIKLKYLIVV